MGRRARFSLQRVKPGGTQPDGATTDFGRSIWRRRTRHARRANLRFRSIDQVARHTLDCRVHSWSACDHTPCLSRISSMWFRNIIVAIVTVARGMFVTLRYWLMTYRADRGAFTEKFEYPEKPVPVTARYRGFHRFDLTTCISCDQCAKACPVDCIYIGKERVESGKGFKITGYTIDYSKCMFCALCVEPCPVDCIFMGATHDLSCYSRDGCIVDFSRLPVDVAWGRASLNPIAVAQSKVITEPVHGGPNQ